MAKILDRLRKPVVCINLGSVSVLASNNENRPDSGLYSMLSSIMRQWVIGQLDGYQVLLYHQ